MSESMKSAVYLGKESIKIRTVPVPVPSDHDVVIQNLYSSICGTDVAVFHHGPNTGHRITIGEEFGHETVSRVVAVGKEVRDFQVGERVYPYPLYAKDDPGRAGTIGGFSEYILVPNAKRNHSLYPVDEAIPDRTACLIEPFTIGFRAARRAQPKPSEAFVVFGCGTIGIASAIGLKWFGAGQVMLCDISDFRLNIARELGFEICNTSKTDFIEHAAKIFGRGFSIAKEAANIDGFIDASGAEEIFPLFMGHGKIESRFVSVAVNNSLRSLDLLHLTFSQKSIIGSGGYMPEDIKDVMEMMKSGKWEIEKIITHEYPIDELEMALRTAGKTDRSFNVVIHF